ncbi:MAG: tetratricopeptide repeat protein [Candidatus Binatia bacterium]
MPDGHILRFGPYQLDAKNEQFWRDGQPVRLTPKAFQVLSYLTERPGQLVTKEELFRVVWADTVVGDAALTMCIQEIRKALQDNAREPRYLETVHRRGFRFIGTVVSSQKPGARSQAGEKNQKAKVKETTQAREKLESVEEGPRDPRATPETESSIALHSIQATEPPLPDKPSIVVLPFINMSQEAGQEYFSDGITEDLTTDLSKISGLFVISRHSAFTSKGKAVKVQDISRELGVQYVLEGSVRRVSDRVRVSAQLIDATTDHHLWAERYDRPLTDIFAVQDEIVQRIMTTLKLQLTLDGHGYLVRKRTDNLEAYDFYLRGVESYYRMTKEDNLRARQMYEKAIALDPQYAEAYAQLGSTYYVEWVWHWSADLQTLGQAVILAQRALALDDSLPMAHSFLGKIYALTQQYDQAITEEERALALDPNNADSYDNQAEALNVMGRPEEALRAIERAIRLNPRSPEWYLGNLGVAYFLLGRYPDAVATLKRALVRNPDFLSAYIILSSSYVHQWGCQQGGDEQTLTQALAAAQRVIALNAAFPEGHTLMGYVSLWRKQHEQALRQIEQALALAPTDAMSTAVLAAVLSYAGRSEEALEAAARALHLKPLIPDIHLAEVGAAYAMAGHYEDALAPLQRFLSRFPNHLLPYLSLVLVYSELGQDAEAQKTAAEVLRLNPKFSLEVHKERMPIKDPSMLERHIAALRKAGLK